MKAATKNISLTPELDRFIDQSVSSGLYETASRVVRDGLRLLRERSELHQKRVARVRAKIEEGWQQSERGDVVSDTDARAHFRKRSAAHRRKRA